MANSKRGEVEIEIEGVTHRLRFTLGAMRSLVDQFGYKTLLEFLKGVQELRLPEVIALYTAGLKRGSLPDATPEVVEEMLNFAEMKTYSDALAKALNAYNTGKVDPPVRRLAAVADPPVTMTTPEPTQGPTKIA